MDVLLTPIKELEEEISIERVTDTKLLGGQSQYLKDQCLQSASNVSIEPVSEENSCIYMCSNPNCETCHQRTGTILSNETNSHSIDAKDNIVESQRIEKSDARVGQDSKSNDKQTDTTSLKNKSKGIAKKPMGSASSVSKNKKSTKAHAKQAVGSPKNSESQVEARLQKGKEYEAKTSKTLRRMEAKYKAIGPTNISSPNTQSTPVIEDAYPTKDDNADKLLKKVKLTTSNLPYHIRSRSAPKKRTPAKQSDAPKSSRGKKGSKEITDDEVTSKTPRKQIENVEIVQQNRGLEKASDRPTYVAPANSNDNIKSAITINELNLESNDDNDQIRQAPCEINRVPSHIRQAALNEGVEEIILIDSPTNFANSKHRLNDDKESTASTSFDDDSGIENDSSRWKIDPKMPNKDQHINIPSTSESSTDHSLSSMSEKSESSSLNKQLQMPSHEMSSSSSPSIRTSLQAMFDINFDEASKNSGGDSKKPDLLGKEVPVVLEDMESLSDDDESDDETSSFELIPNNECSNFASHELIDQISSVKVQDSPSAKDSLESKSSHSPSSFTKLLFPVIEQPTQNMTSAMADRPVSSRAWENNESSTSVKDQVVPFERYLQPRGEDINSDDGNVAAALDINVEEECLSSEELEDSISTVLTKQAIMKHNWLHNKHLDVVRDTEPHYKDEDRAHMQSRLSSATGTTDFSIVTDSTLTVDVDNSNFNGLKKGKELGHGAFGTVFEGLTADGKLVAVKQVELTIANREIANKEYKRVQYEVNLLRTLQHKNIVRLLGTSFDGACVRIFMEHVPGGSIKSILTQYGALDERIFRTYTKQILQGLAYLHGSGVVHRDIKGSNIMLMTNGTVKLIDFGCAKRLRESALLRESAGSRGDRLLKTMLGTPYWMAPEVITSQGHGPKSDIWSVGATVYEMATTQPPLKNLEATAAMFHIGCGNEMPELAKREFSRSVINFVKKCFTRDQYQRPQASELLNHRFMTRQKVSKLTSK